MSFSRLSTHPEYPKRIKSDDDNYEENCPFFDKKRMPRPDYEDPEDIKEEELKDNRFIWTWYNNIPELVSLRDAEIDFKNGKPITPIRTGIKGRGILPKFGPQHAADPVVTRYINNRLHFLAVLRSDVNEYAIPGGFIDAGEKYPATLKREFEEESCQGTHPEILNKVFENGDIIYAGPTFDDPRTTDNAWIETIVVHYHITEDLAKKIKLKPQPGETKKVEWIDCEGNLYGGHSHFLKLVKNKMNNESVVNTIPINFDQFKEVGAVFTYLIFVIFLMYQLLSLDKEIRLQEQIDKCIELDLFLEYSKINCTM